MSTSQTDVTRNEIMSSSLPERMNAGKVSTCPSMKYLPFPAH